MIEVEILDMGQSSRSGIGRYISELHRHLKPTKVIVTKRKIRPFWGAKYFSSLQYLPITVQEHKPGTIVHFPQIMGCALMLWNPLRPAVATIHDLGILELPEERAMLDPVARQILNLSLAGLKKMDRIVTDSEYTRQGVLRHLGVSAEQVVTVYLGLDHDIFQTIPDARQRLGTLYPEICSLALEPLLLYVGSELPRKNILTLLEALSILRDQYPNITLLKVGAAGGKRFRTSTEDIIRQFRLQRNVLFFESVSDKELALFYNAADLFIQPSKLEGFGLPVLEAMACGTPVICSNAGSLSEVVGSTAIVIPTGDITSLATSITHALCNKEETLQLAQHGKERSKIFSWETTARQMSEVYAQIATEAARVKFPARSTGP